MKLIKIRLPDDTTRDIELFRSGDGFESLAGYVDRVLIPFVLENIPEASVIRCSLSGFAIGMYMQSEVAATVRQSVVATNMIRFNDLLAEVSVKTFSPALEMVLDDVSIRTLILARKSPVMAGARGKPAIDSAPRPRQLMLLLNQLLYDVGMMRDRYVDSFDTIERLRRSARVADIIAKEWQGELGTGSETAESNRFEDLYAGLVELDAKWQISRLKFTTKEQATLNMHREARILDIDKLRAFVWSMIVYRDVNTDLEPTSSWTREAYKTVSFSTYDSAQSREHSNVWVDDKPSNRHIKSKTAQGTGVKKESKSKDPNRAMFSSILGGLF